ncbi:MAG: family transcriptional regulator [Myxococcaceae bacterium]|nr:family transcriptional regulator [Myxococcaceae bacterium]
MSSGRFTPERLALARMRRGLRQQDVGERCGVDARTVRGWERGEWPPDVTSLTALSRALRFPVSFFTAPPLALIDTDRASFRSLSTMRAAQRDAVHAAGTLVVPLREWLVSRFRLPDLDVPDLGGETPERAAEIVREAWGLGGSVAPNIVHLLELHGVHVFSLAEDAREVDAFSFWDAGRAYVMLNTMKSPERGRFDAAHELGHLVLHRQGDIHAPEVEHQANRFASAFLMPHAGLLKQRPASVTMQAALGLKVHWRVSIAAMIHRLSQLSVLTEWQYRELMVDVQRRGWRTTEPYGIQRRETSQVLAKAFGPLRREGDDAKDVARRIHLPIEEVQRMIFGLVLADPVPDSKALPRPTVAPAARLRRSDLKVIPGSGPNVRRSETKRDVKP